MRTILSIVVAGLSALLSPMISGYQFDSVKGPGYPVIIPPPKKLFSFGGETWALPPCKLTVNAEMPPSYDPDTQLWVRNTLAWYVDKEIFINDSCD